MILRLIRHSETIWNKEWRFQGSVDIPLSEYGKELLRSEKNVPAKVYVSGLKRTFQTAEIIFPGAELIKVPGLDEMNFGIVEGKTHDEMKDDPDYKAWIEGGREDAPPGGEDKKTFAHRVAEAFESIIRAEAGSDEVTVVAHGGTIMAALSRFDIRAKGEYFEYLTANADGYEIEISGDISDMKWRILRHISYRKDFGFAHLYHGNGRGKTSIAMGTALRALENGYSVTVFQMCKTPGSSETAFLEKNNVKVVYGLKEPVLPKNMNDAQKAEAKIRQTDILTKIMDDIKMQRGDGTPKLLVLDEVCAAVYHGIIDEDLLWDAVLRRPHDLELVMTGRRPAEWMKEASDYCTELVCDSHPLEKGVPARKGIDK